MKKTFYFLLLLSVISVFIKYWFSDYKIEYKINGYNVNTIQEKERIYYEIKNDKVSYNFDIYEKKHISKKTIKNIIEIEGEDFNCIYPQIDNIKTYPLCKKDETFIDYNLIDSDLLYEYKNNTTYEESKNDFIFYDNLSKNEYIALWNYKGFYIMNSGNYNNVELFNKDRYDNNLSYLYNDTIYIANYDSEHTFNKLILLNIKNQNINEIEFNYDIDFDSYFVGSVGKNIYIYDNKYSILYELNTKNNEMKIKCNNETGYVKYENNKFVKCSKTEYKVNKISYDKNESIYKYEYNNGLYKSINNNNKIKQLINNDNVNILKENKNELYYSNKNEFYKYSPSTGNIKIFYYYELEFNNKNMIYVYLNN